MQSCFQRLVQFHGHEDGALVSRARILMLDDDDLIQLITEVTGTGGISLHDNNGKVKRPQIANRLQQRELRLGELKLEQLQKIVAKEKWTGVSSYNWAKLMQFLTDNPQALPAPPKPNPNPTWKQQLKEAEDQGNLVRGPSDEAG